MRQYGRRFKKGIDCIIESEVVIGDNVTLGHNVTLRDGTIIGNNVVLADNVCTTGLCYVGNGVRIRTGSIISRGVIIEDYVFIGAGVTTSHTKNISYNRPEMEEKNFITRIGYGAIIGSSSCLAAGIDIGDGAVIGYASFVNKNVEDGTIVYGVPAKLMGNVNKEEQIKKDPLWKKFNFKIEDLVKYLPKAL